MNIGLCLTSTLKLQYEVFTLLKGKSGISPGSLTSSHGESVYQDDLAMAVNVGSIMVDKNDELESAVSSLKHRLKEQDAEFEKEREKMEEHIVRLERTNHNLQNDLLTV
eukprot:754294_1